VTACTCDAPGATLAGPYGAYVKMLGPAYYWWPDGYRYWDAVIADTVRTLHRIDPPGAYLGAGTQGCSLDE
jgi:hypothetical protein